MAQVADEVGGDVTLAYNRGNRPAALLRNGVAAFALRSAMVWFAEPCSEGRLETHGVQDSEGGFRQAVA